ncbi:Hypothetical protein NTJ_13175 [Nesidiocoris tenuis]|uniref:FAD/NAD(P)-binding domain-containing protein n=1 Tax=Nesidiocoris tenuis TaxID=355587 RepID=A0ABN7B7W3_9HEMI|nr:Hypothetical protein NTJ_13175 [Nesidiocoris tenuis]
MKDNLLSSKRPPIYKDVVIIGNGPSGLAMSYLLSGHVPVYNGNSHPDPILDTLLRSNLRPGLPVTQADLLTLAQCLEGRNGATPVGLLVDAMVRPGTDAGLTAAPLLTWNTTRPSLSHVVIGRDRPGGTWQKIDGKTLTLSSSSWMELPGLPFHKSDAGRLADVTEDGVRVTASTVGDYYSEYVQKMGLLRYQKRGIVTGVSEHDDSDEDNDRKVHWVVEGHDHRGRKFVYHSKYIVLACGTNDSPNRLGIPGEDLDWVKHNTRDLDAYLKSLRSTVEDGPVLIVGSGLSSCDGVMTAQCHGASVLHLYRGHGGLAKWLPLTSYPEYHKVHTLMTGKATDRNYAGSSDLRLVGIDSNSKTAILEDGKGGQHCQRVTAVAILVGASADLSFLPRWDLGFDGGPANSKSNPLDVNLSTYELNRLPNAYAIGPLAGDTFVRHVLGGVIAASSHILETPTT